LQAPAPDRFEWERIAPKFEWIRLLEALPVTSPLFTHPLCEKRCQRPDGGGRLRPATLKHVGVTLAHHANENGKHAHPGIGRLALETSRHRSTIIVALGHLETVGLIGAQIRGGMVGTPRTFASDYSLMYPPLDTLAATAANDPEARIYDFFNRENGQS
jgi:Helix-turn-helix domain